LPGCPYRTFTADAVCRWVWFRRAFSGAPRWVPEELTYLSLPRGRHASLCPLISSGLACGRWGQPVLLRGLQEAIERDAAVGASWGRYPLEEFEADQIFASLQHDSESHTRGARSGSEGDAVCVSLPPLRGEGRVGGNRVALV